MDLASLGLIIWLMDLCKKRRTTSIVYVMSQKGTSHIIIWLMDLEDSLLGSNYLARGLVKKGKVTTSRLYVMSQKDLSDIIVWLTDLAKKRLLRQII